MVARRRSICSLGKMIGPAVARRQVSPRRTRRDGQPRVGRKRRPRRRPQLLQDGGTGGGRDSGATGAARPGAATDGRRTAATGGARFRTDEEGGDGRDDAAAAATTQTNKIGFRLEVDAP
jgi:hypothetical protein